MYVPPAVSQIDKLAKLRDARAPEEVEEERAWVALKEARKIGAVHFDVTRISELRASREVLWDCFERAVAASRARAGMKAKMEHELASTDDARSKADAWILTKQGSAKYEFLCRQAYGNLLHEEYVRRGHPLKALAALHAPGDAPVTLATSIAFRHPRLGLLKLARGTAMRAIVDRFVKQETAAAADRARREEAQQKVDFEALRAELVVEFGQRGTSWDLLWDPNEQQHYLAHLEEGGELRRYDKDTAICDNCDEMIPPEDRICPGCDAERSAKVLGSLAPQNDTETALTVYKDDDLRPHHTSTPEIMCRRTSGARLAAPVLPNGPYVDEKGLLFHPRSPPREPTDQMQIARRTKNKELYRGFNVWPEQISAGGKTEAKLQSSNDLRRL